MPIELKKEEMQYYINNENTNYTFRNSSLRIFTKKVLKLQSMYFNTYGKILLKKLKVRKCNNSYNNTERHSICCCFLCFFTCN